MMKLLPIVFCIVIVLQEAYSNCIVTFEVTKLDEAELETQITVEAKDPSKCAALCHRNGCKMAKFNPTLRHCSFLKLDHVQCANTKRYFQYTTENTVWLQCMNSKCTANPKLLWLPKTRAETIAETIEESINTAVINGDFEEKTITDKPLVHAPVPFTISSTRNDANGEQIKQDNQAKNDPKKAEREIDLWFFGKPEFSQHGTIDIEATPTENLKTTAQNGVLSMVETSPKGLTYPITTDQSYMMTSPKVTTYPETTVYLDTKTYPYNSDRTSDPDDTNSKSDPENTTYLSYPDDTTNPGYPDDTTNPGYPDDTTNPGYPDDTTNPGYPDDTTNPGYPDDTTNPGYPDDSTNTSFGVTENTTYSGYPKNRTYADNTTNPGYPDYAAQSDNVSYGEMTPNPETKAPQEAIPTNLQASALPETTTYAEKPDYTQPASSNPLIGRSYRTTTANRQIKVHTETVVNREIATHSEIGSEPQTSTYQKPLRSGIPILQSTSPEIKSTMNAMSTAMKGKFAGPFVCGLTFAISPLYTIDESVRFTTTRRTMSAAVCAGYCFLQACTRAAYDPLTKLCLITLDGNIPESCPTKFKTSMHVSNEQIWIECVQCDDLFLSSVYREKGSAGLNAADRQQGDALLKQRLTELKLPKQLASSGQLEGNRACVIVFEIDQSIVTDKFSQATITLSTANCARRCYAVRCSHAVFEPTSGRCLIGFDKFSDKCSDEKLIAVHRTQHGVGLRCIQCVDDARFRDLYGAEIVKTPIDWFPTSTPVSSLSQGNNLLYGCWFSFELTKPDGNIGKLVEHFSYKSAYNCVNHCYMEGCSKVSWSPNLEICLLSFDGPTASSRCSQTKRYVEYIGTEMVAFQCIKLECDGHYES